VRNASIIRTIIRAVIVALMMEALRTSETSVYFNETTRATSQIAVIVVNWFILFEKAIGVNNE
jgi:hypothetical protein